MAAFCFAAAGNVRNDVMDVAIDRVAHPSRPLARGSLSLRAARTWALVWYAIAIVAGALVSWLGLVLVVAALPLMEGYERIAKARGLIGNAMIGLLSGAPFILGAIAVDHVGLAVLALAGLAALATLAREILKDAEDVDADRGARRTLPMTIGAARAGRVAAAFLVVAIALSPLPWVLETVLGVAYLPAVGAADLCFLVAAFTGSGAPGRAQRFVKMGMVVALAALLVGRVWG